jgi:hypothetical protein
MTSQLWVLDVVLNEPFKDHLRQLFSEWLLGGDHYLKPAQRRIKNLSVTVLCQWIITAWQHIQPEVAVKGFKKFCISCAMVGSVDVFRIMLKRLGMVAVIVRNTLHEG